jgi:cytidine deaminase
VRGRASGAAVPTSRPQAPVAAPGDAAPTRDELVELARAARERAYAPYSKFRVGVALRSSGRTFYSANVENASYGLTLCAERVAVAAAVVSGAPGLEAIAIASDVAVPTPPCGACLQTLAEFGAPDLPITLAGAEGAVKQTTLAELLPVAFSRDHLRR